MKPDDKPFSLPDSVEEPVLFRVIDGRKFPVPSLETAFVDF